MTRPAGIAMAAACAALMLLSITTRVHAQNGPGASVDVASPMMSPRADAIRFRPGCWIPVCVMSSNEGQGDLDAEVSLEPVDDSGQRLGEFVVDARMPSSSRKAIPGLAMAPCSAVMLKLACSSSAVSPVVPGINLQAVDPATPVALLLSRDSGARAFFADEAIWGGPFELFPCDKHLLPDRPEGLEPVDWVLLPDDCALEPDRVDALSEWVKRGGNILIWSAAGRDAGVASGFVDLPDLGFESVDSGSFGLAAGRPVRVRKTGAGAGETLAAVGSLPVLLDFWSGAGRVLFAAIDLSRPGMQDWNGRVSALAPMTSSLRRPATGMLHSQAASVIGGVPYTGEGWRMLAALALFAALAGPPGFFAARRLFSWRAVLLINLAAGVSACILAASAGAWLFRGAPGHAEYYVAHSSSGAGHALIETFGLSASGTVTDLVVAAESGEVVGPMFPGRGRAFRFRCFTGSEPKLVAPGLPAGVPLPWRKLSREPFKAPAGRFETGPGESFSGSLLDAGSLFAPGSALVIGHTVAPLESAAGPSGARLLPAGPAAELGAGALPNVDIRFSPADAFGIGRMRRDPSTGEFLLTAHAVSMRADSPDGLLIVRTEVSTSPRYFIFPPGFIEKRWLDPEGEPVQDLPGNGLIRGLKLISGGSAILEGFLPALPEEGAGFELCAGTTLTPLNPKEKSAWISPPAVDMYVWDKGEFGIVADHRRLIGDNGRVLARFANRGTASIELVRPWIKARSWKSR